VRDLNGAYLHATAVVTGDVVLAKGVSLWPHVVVRGDIAPICIGAGTNLQDGAIAHTEFEIPLLIGDNVVVGHRAVLHGHKVGRGCLIGMGAMLLSGSEVGDECIIAAGAVVTEGKKIPPRSLVMGMPGKIVRQVTDDEVAYIEKIRLRYQELATEYAAGKFPDW
jgi:carbonic anhydrase/acetyltransferase-like protein (isoleucine patch superfamily)